MTVAKMQMVEIAKAVSYDSRIVIMDEPTSSLTDAEVEHLFRIIAELKEKNVAIIYISHKMDEIFRISDDITVYRDGEYIATDRAENLNVDKVIQLMVGREVNNMFPKVHVAISELQRGGRGVQGPADSVLADGQSLRHRGDAHRHHLPRRLRQNDRYGHRRLYLRRHVLRRQPV